MTLELLIYITASVQSILLIWTIFLHVRIQRIFKGPKGDSIEGVLQSINKHIVDLHTFESESTSYFKSVEKRLNRSIQAVEMIRFNPFKGTGEGGNQSFATSLVNQKGDGLILSSMYARDRVSIFAKPLKEFKSSFELTEEEQQVLSTAQKTLKE